jgi:hypothetical protein
VSASVKFQDKKSQDDEALSLRIYADAISCIGHSTGLYLHIMNLPPFVQVDLAVIPSGEIVAMRLDPTRRPGRKPPDRVFIASRT